MSPIKGPQSSLIRPEWADQYLCYLGLQPEPPNINFNLCRLLSQLGFQARLMRANGGNHIMVGVKLDGRLYLSDAAHGGPLFKAVDLAATTRAEEFGRGVHIYPMVDEAGAYHFDQYADGEHRIFVCPRGRYHMNFMSCSLYQELPRRHLALSNNRFTIRLPDSIETLASLGVDVFTSEA